jgi:CO/xanthine dehydrogenase FAD-binding subunit
MNTTDLTFEAPTTVEEVVDLLVRWHGDARPLAGGMSLMPDMHLGVHSPRALVSLSRVDELTAVRQDGETLWLGAAVTQRTLATHDLVRRVCPVLSRAAAGLADVQVRNRGTVGGSLANAHPGAEAATVLSALGAEVVLRGPAGRRTLPVVDFVLGAGHTALAPDELVEAVRIPPARAGSYADYLRFSRIQGNYSTVNAAAVVDADRTRVALGGATPRPVVVEMPEPIRAADDELRLAELAQRAASACADAYDDHMASADYRRALAGVLALRVAVSALDHPVSSPEGL